MNVQEVFGFIDINLTAKTNFKKTNGDLVRQRKSEQQSVKVISNGSVVVLMDVVLWECTLY